MELQTLLDAYNEFVVKPQTYKEHPHMLHLRFRTHGQDNAVNTHPFLVKDGAMIHNGTLWYGDKESSKSDTAQFCETLHDDLTYENVAKASKDIGDVVSYNKLVFLYDGGKYVIVNEKAGLWEQGVWYSNGGFRNYGNSRRY